MAEAINCAIYKSNRKLETYLFLREKDDFSDVPEILLKGFGPPEFVMELELTPQRKLARSDIGEVMHNLRENGYFLQMPPPDPLAPYRVVEKKPEAED